MRKRISLFVNCYRYRYFIWTIFRLIVLNYIVCQYNAHETCSMQLNVCVIMMCCSRLAMCSVDPMQSVLYGGPRPGITPSYHQLGLQLALAGLGAQSADHITTHSIDKTHTDLRSCISNENSGKYLNDSKTLFTRSPHAVQCRIRVKNHRTTLLSSQLKNKAYKFINVYW